MEELRVENWIELQEQLLADSWSEALGRHRSDFANVFTTEILAKVADDLAGFDRIGEDFVVFVEPPSFDERIVNPYALFSLITGTGSSLDQLLERHPELVRRIVIRAELKWEIRDKLDQANTTERVLFPGLDGLSRWVARYYAPRETE
jgi:hypothetical protein